MSQSRYANIFQDKDRDLTDKAIALALEEDGRDLTTIGLFGPDETMRAEIVAKEKAVVCGLPLLDRVTEMAAEPGATPCSCRLLTGEGSLVNTGITVAALSGPARTLLRAERVMLNLLCRLSGVASLTREYSLALDGTGAKLLDTRKTTPCLRRLEKYAVRVGGGHNHRMNLEDMLMLKDTHLDRAGSIREAVAMLRRVHSPCPPIEVECRTLDDVREAVSSGAERVMLDNMDTDAIRRALELIPPGTESEISGGVNLETARTLASLGADYLSVGRLTHSARAIDFSMRTIPE
ncbi:carboxylating nicotinate-nucleotide diphosphorylase [Desulfohalovibrio reitneri]|uniref:carboxylating nicotinate-nucleotide diphosphorylase n=1 Tax=Desulfohalovibrio reitneri TaxID=1307759 RepID=UPI0004A76FD0|nr:carboxylating nicotinate-nucleotide diphosphorylase [Desulfohalovibrio reitneri]